MIDVAEMLKEAQQVIKANNALIKKNDAIMKRLDSKLTLQEKKELYKDLDVIELDAFR